MRVRGSIPPTDPSPFVQQPGLTPSWLPPAASRHPSLPLASSGRSMLPVCHENKCWPQRITPGTHQHRWEEASPSEGVKRLTDGLSSKTERSRVPAANTTPTPPRLSPAVLCAGLIL
ncbi:hypothetical protein E2C01_060730 [Portunus trituberculatus]|uniref:Uncharacterized protein n=1 Tax=Portunus trituberculatus TaxID=210409 RepID=A0A5B7H200_PORTR|nr:hypothetical protein [Portunus trituberculatus]